MTRRTHNTKSGSRDFQEERTTRPKTLWKEAYWHFQLTERRPLKEPWEERRAKKKMQLRCRQAG